MDYIIYSVEDDRDISYLINKTLSTQGYNVRSFLNGEAFLEAMQKEKPNMILLDMMLPGISGGDILRKVRENPTYDDIDIIIISANSLVMDKVDGLDLGADDYIEKPFNLLELISRINAKVRRYKKNRSIKLGDVTIDLDKYTCYKGEEQINLTSKEFEILKLLLNAKGNVVTRDEIINKIWGVDAVFETRTVDMHIMSLRQKLSDKENKLIVTIHGIGYKLII